MITPNQIIVLTADQLKELVTEIIESVVGRRDEAPAEETPAVDINRYAYGLRGICDLFSVSLTTAQRYKNTFLGPAITQRGRTIMIDKAKAIELFSEFRDEVGE